MGSDDVMTLITEDETMFSEERFWFASPNLRLRTSVLKRADGVSVAFVLFRNSDGRRSTC